MSADVRLEGVGKQYRKGVRRNAERFWALKDVSFEVERGSSTGIIGRNGAGKSTLLKLLAGITAPTVGRIFLSGHPSALIEVGSGFHPELTGRENVYLSGAILGMKRKEIDAKLPAILEFAGVTAFIDTPVKWYSSGMYVRLGFSIAAHLEPDILLVDEVLAVGDGEFQAKCLQRIRDLRRQGVTIVFISHDLTAVEQLCDAAVLMDHGTVIDRGNPHEIVARYHRRMIGVEANPQMKGSPAPGTLALTSLTFHGSRDGIAFSTGVPLTAALRFEVHGPQPPLRFELTFYSSDGKSRIASARSGAVHVRQPGGRAELTCRELPLPMGIYYVGAAVRNADTSELVTWWDGGSLLYVGMKADPAELIDLPHTWNIVHDSAAIETDLAFCDPVRLTS